MTTSTTAYRRRLAYDRINGIQRRVDATQTRHHLERLTALGWTYQQIAAATGLDSTTMSVIRSGRYQRVARNTAVTILAIRLDQKPPIPRGLTEATGTRRRLQALMVLGYPLPDVARLTGVSYNSLHQTAAGMWASVRTPTADKVKAVYRRLSLTPAPPTQYAEYARNEAMANGWYGPMAWNDIDDPSCLPDPTEPSAPRHVHPDDVAELAKRGLDDKAMGKRLGVSERTILRARAVHGIELAVAS